MPGRLSEIATKADALAGSERLEVTQSGATKYTDPAQLRDYVAGALGTPPQFAALQNASGMSVSGGGGFIRLDLTSELYDPFGIVSLSGGNFVLGAGTYLLLAALNGYMTFSTDPARSQRVQFEFYNNTDTVSLAEADNYCAIQEVQGGGAFRGTVAVAFGGLVTLTGTKTLSLRGNPANIDCGVEIVPPGTSGWHVLIAKLA